MRTKIQRKKGEKGFTLIELGIVIGVIAVLSTLVFVGRGFLNTARIAKAIEAVNNVKKATHVWSGTNQGQLPVDKELLVELSARDFIPAGVGWTPISGFSFQGGTTKAAGFSIQMNCPERFCQDLYNSVTDDEDFKEVADLDCTTSEPDASATSVTLCFGMES